MKEAYKYIIMTISLIVVIYFISMGESLSISKEKEEETTKYSSELEESAELKAAYEFSPNKADYTSYEDYKVSINAYSIDGLDEWNKWKKLKDDTVSNVDYGQGKEKKKTSARKGSYSNGNDNYIELSPDEDTAINLFTGEIISKEEEQTTKIDSSTNKNKSDKKDKDEVTTKNNSATTTNKSSKKDTTNDEAITKKADTTTTKQATTTTTTKKPTTTAPTTTTQSETTTNSSGYMTEIVDGVTYYVYFAKVSRVPSFSVTDYFIAVYENDGYTTNIYCVDNDTEETIFNVKNLKEKDRVKLYFKEIKTEGKAWRMHPKKIEIVK